MSKLDNARTVLKGISTSISEIKAEVRNIENIYNEKIVINNLIEENKRLEESIEISKKELILLENLKGRDQANENKHPPKYMVKSSAPSQNNKILEGNKHDSLNNEAINQNVNVRQKHCENKTVKNKIGVVLKPCPINKENKEGPISIDVGRLDLRVGKIKEVSKHPDADSLYVEKIDIGKNILITVISGLVNHVPIKDMENRLVVLLCNLKPVKMRGITSEGMVMCASTPEKVEILSPPANSIPGDKVSVPGYISQPDPILNPKKKIFETVAPDLKTDSDCNACYKGVKWVVEGKGHIKSQTLTNVAIK